MAKTQRVRVQPMTADALAAWRAKRTSTQVERLTEQALSAFAHGGRVRARRHFQQRDPELKPPYRPATARPFYETCRKLIVELRTDGKSQRSAERWIVDRVLRTFPPAKFTWLYDVADGDDAGDVLLNRLRAAMHPRRMG